MKFIKDNNGAVSAELPLLRQELANFTEFIKSGDRCSASTCGSKSNSITNNAPSNEQQAGGSAKKVQRRQRQQQPNDCSYAALEKEDIACSPLRNHLGEGSKREAAKAKPNMRKPRRAKNGGLFKCFGS